MVKTNEEPIQFTLSPGSALTHAPLNPSATGRWRSVELNGQPAGLAWTDDSAAVGFYPYDLDVAPSAKQAQGVFSTFLRLARDNSLSASATYVGFENLQGASLGPEKTGPLSRVLVTARTAPTSLTAAVASENEPTGEINAVIDVESEKVLDLILVNADGIYVRENGAWSLLPGDDERVDGPEWLEVTPDAVKAWDEDNNRQRGDVVPFAVAP